MPAATPLTFGSLFAGIGGMDLGLERAGWQCRWQVEIDDYARRILAKHWPDVRRHDDVRTFPPDDGTDWTVDLIAGGFPCQPVSIAGKRLGEADDRWLWPEFLRVIRAIRPRFVLLENVPGLFVRGFDRVLGDLAASGYDAEWDCLPASAFGAPHQRDRVFVVAYTSGFDPESRGVSGNMACPTGSGQRNGAQRKRNGYAALDRGATVADPASQRRATRGVKPRGDRKGVDKVDAAEAGPVLDPWLHSARVPSSRVFGRHPSGEWLPEPGVGRVVDGIPGRLDKSRLRALGNAVVPAVAEHIGRRLMEIAS